MILRKLKLTYLVIGIWVAANWRLGTGRGPADDVPDEFEQHQRGHPFPRHEARRARKGGR